MNVGLMIIELEKEHLGDDQVGTAVVDYALQKADAVFEEAAVDVENTFFAAAALDHVGNQGHGKVLQGSRLRQEGRQPGIRVVRENGKGRPVMERWPSPFRCGPSVLPLVFLFLRKFQEHVIHKSKFLGLLSAEVPVALRFLFDLINRPTGMVGKDLVETAA